MNFTVGIQICILLVFSPPKKIQTTCLFVHPIITMVKELALYNTRPSVQEVIGMSRHVGDTFTSSLTNTFQH